MTIKLTQGVEWGGKPYAQGESIPGLTDAQETALVGEGRAIWMSTPTAVGGRVSVEADSSGVVGGAQIALMQPARRIGVVGHSIPAQSFNYANSGYGGLAGDKGYSSYGFVSFGLYLSGYLGPVNAYAVAGSTTAVLVDQVRSAIAAGCDLIVMHNGGVNDAALSASESIGNLTAAVRAVTAAGVKLLIATEVSTEIFGSSAARINTINAFIRSLQRAAPLQIHVMDFAAITSSPHASDGGSFTSILDDLTYDTTHPNQMAAYLMGKEMVRAAGAWLAGDPHQTINGANYLANGRCGGSSGTVTSGAANSAAPDSWISDRHGAASVNFASYVARDIAIRWPRPLTSGSAANAIPIGLRVRPTIRDGFHYVALTAGSVAWANAAEPSGAAPWTTVSTSGITWLVVPENDRNTLPGRNGQTVIADFTTDTAGASDYWRMYQEVDVANIADTTALQGVMRVVPMDGYLGGACLRLSFLNSGGSIIGNTWGMAPQILSSSSGYPYYAPWSRDGGLVVTPPMDAPAGTAKVRFSVQMFGMGSDAAAPTKCRVGVTDCVLRNGEI